MRATLVLMLGLGACGLDADTFDKRYEDLYCKVLEDECGGTCLDRAEGVLLDCDFDPDLAKECLEGEWVCLPLGTGDDDPGIPQGPAACAEVYTNCSVEPDSGSDG